ncbi:MAG: cation:proton antiporter [Aquincola sp.]|nr:cation:proton antiporter [Aquincola sp.]
MNDLWSWVPWSTLGPPDVPVLLAAVVVAGAIAGELIARTTRLPRVVGYTLAGWAAALGGFGVTLPLNPTARLLIDMALALLLFEIGSRVRLRWLRHNPGLLATSVLESLAAGVAVYLALVFIGQPSLVAGACAVLAIPASAAVAGRVAQEIRAEGQVTQRMGYLTALNTLYGVLALVVLKGWIETERAPDLLVAAHALLVSSIGALLLAALLGLAVSLAARRLDLRQEGPALLVLGLVLLAVSAARWMGVSTLLVPLLAGMLLRNVSDRAWSWPRHFGTAGGLLVLLLFVMVGSAWSPALLVAGGAAALALLAARALAKALVVWLLSRWSQLSLKKGIALSMTLTPLSATALVMLSELERADPAFGASLAPIVLTAVALVELIGPVAVLVALRFAGEVASEAPAPAKEPT